MSSDEGWYDEAAGPLVRPYTITSGRTPSDAARLDLSTQVMTLRSEQEPVGLGPEHVAIVQLCRRSVSIAAWSSWKSPSIGSMTEDDGNAWCSSSDAKLAFSRAWTTARRTSSSDGSAAYA